MSNIVNRFWTQEMPVYDEIERCFKLNDANGLSKVINDTGKDLLQKDLNFGLAQQVLTCLTKHRIKNLTKTYITLSLQDIAAKVDCDSVTVEKHLLKMTKLGEIHASIDAMTNMVRFGDVQSSSITDQVKFNSTVELALNQTMALSDKLRDMHKNILTSNSYLLKSVPGGKRRGEDMLERIGSGGWPGGMGGMGGMGYPMDDDAMDYY